MQAGPLCSQWHYERTNVSRFRTDRYPHFDNHPQASRPLYMDNNTRSHRARIVNQYKQQEAIDTIPWPAMSQDMNPIEHVWDYIGQRFNHRNPQCQNFAELRTAMVEEWQNFLQYKLRRLVHSMKRRVRELFREVRRFYTLLTVLQ